MQDTIAEKLLATLRRINPAKVVVYNGDDDEKPRTVAVPTRRRKWAQVITTIESLAWSRLEMQDRSGALMGTLVNDAPARDLEDLSGNRTGELGPHDVQMTRVLLDVMLKAQREVLTFRDRETTALLEAQGTVLREMTAAMTSLATIYRSQVEAAADVAGLRAEAEARAEAGDGSVKELLEAAPQLIQLLPVLKNLLGAGGKPAPTPPPANGAKG